MEDGLRLAPDWLELQLVLAYAEAKAGRRERSATRLVELLRSTNGTYLNPVLVAGVYSGLGDADKAIEWLERGFAEKGSFMAWIAIEPQFFGLHEDPRFQDLVRRVRRG